MSKFTDKLHKISRSVAAPIGFHAATSELGNSSLLLIVGIFSADIKKVKILDGISIDAALILNQNLGLKKTKQFAKVLSDTPLGIIINQLSEINSANSVAADLDFIAFDKQVSMTNVEKTAVGKLFMIDASFNMDLTKAVNEIDLDGVIIDNSQEELLSVEHLLICQRLHELLHKPLLMILPPLVTSAELCRLREVGITGVISSKTWSVESLIDLRHKIDNLPKKEARRNSKIDAILPSYTGYKDEDEDEDEDDDEE
jgi:hypothetical protein